MSLLSCRKCLHNEECGCEFVCEHFTPSDDESENWMIDQMVEDGRIEYREAWFVYLSDDYE